MSSVNLRIVSTCGVVTGDLTKTERFTDTDGVLPPRSAYLPQKEGNH
jgi:hypothetical protein